MTHEHATTQPSFFSLSSYKEHQYLLIILFVQIGFCIYGMWHKPLWLDEAYSAVMARLPVTDIHRAMIYDAGPPLYYDVLHVWRVLFGEEEAVLRLFSLICAMGVTVLIYTFCYRRINRCVAVYSSLLWAVSPLSVYYAIEARNYTFLTLLSLAYIYAIYSYLLHHNYYYLCISTLLLILLLYTHNTALYYIPITLFVSVVVNRKWKVTAGIAISLVVALLAYIPWIGMLRQQLSQSELTIGWIEAFWTWLMPMYTFAVYVPGGYNLPYMNMPQLALGLQVCVYLLFGCIVVYSIYQAYKIKSNSIFYVGLFLILTLFLSYWQSILLSPTYLAGRTDFFVFPLFAIVIGYGIANITIDRWKYGMYGLVILPCCVVNGMLLFTPPALSEWELIKTLEYQSRPGDVIICTGLSRPIVEYALADDGVTILSYPQDMEQHLAHMNEAWYLQHVDLQQEAQRVMQRAVDDRNDGRIIVLWSGREINRPLQELIDSDAYQNLTRNIYSHPRMGLSRLNEPLSLWILQ